MSFQLASHGCGWRTRPDKEKQFPSSCCKGETVGVRLLQGSTHYQCSISSCWYLRESPQIPRPEFRIAITTKYHKRELVPSYLCIPAPVPETAMELLRITAAAAAAKSLQSCPTLCDPIDGSPPGSLNPWDSPGKNTGVGCPENSYSENITPYKTIKIIMREVLCKH